jgi:hypothetical protein
MGRWVRSELIKEVYEFGKRSVGRSVIVDMWLGLRSGRAGGGLIPFGRRRLGTRGIGCGSFLPFSGRGGAIRGDWDESSLKAHIVAIRAAVIEPSAVMALKPRTAAHLALDLNELGAITSWADRTGRYGRTVGSRGVPLHLGRIPLPSRLEFYQSLEGSLYRVKPIGLIRVCC